MAAGVTTILLTPGDPLALADTVTKVREGGVTVIALDTQMNPTNVADATLATDNFQAGLFIGEWAKGTLGDAAADAVVALLDVSDGKQITTEVQRDQGFMQGFGIADIGDPTKLYDETDPRIAGYGATDGNQDARPYGHGEPARQEPGHQPRVHHQRARRGRRLRGDPGGCPRP